MTSFTWNAEDPDVVVVFRDGDWWTVPIYRLDEWLNEGEQDDA